MDSGEQANEQERERLKEKSGTGGKVQFVQWEGGGRCGTTWVEYFSGNTTKTGTTSADMYYCAFLIAEGERSRTATDADRFLPLIDDRW